MRRSRSITAALSLDRKRSATYSFQDTELAIFIPPVCLEEALAGMAVDLHQAIVNYKRPLVDGRTGLKIVELLEQTQQALDSSLDKLARLRIFKTAVGLPR